MRTKSLKYLFLLSTVFLATSCNGGSTPAHEHHFGEWTVDKAATCVATGIRSHTCTECGAVESEEIPIDPTAHEWGKWEVTTPGTCVTPSIETRVCEYCSDHKETREGEIDPDHHHWAITIESEPTTKTYNAFDEFNSTGFTATLKCSDCGEEGGTYTADKFDYYADEDLTREKLEVGDTVVYAALKEDHSSVVEIENITVNKCTESLPDFGFKSICQTKPTDPAIHGTKSDDKAAIEYYSDQACTQKVTDWKTMTADGSKKVYCKATLAATKNYDEVTKTSSAVIEHDPVNTAGTGTDAGKDIVKCSKCNAELHKFTTSVTETLYFDDTVTSSKINLSGLSTVAYKLYSDVECTKEITTPAQAEIQKSAITGFSEKTNVKQEGTAYVYAKEDVYGIIHTITIPAVNVTKLVKTADDVKGIAGDITMEGSDKLGYFLVINDIDFGGSTSNYTNIISGYNSSNWWQHKLFKGTVDGDGHTIKNVYLNGTSGLFGSMGPSCVKNINFVDCGLGPTTASGEYYTPFICAYDSQLTMSNVSVTFKDIITPKITTVPAGYCLGNALLFSRYGCLGQEEITNVTVDASAPGCTADVCCVIASSLDQFKVDNPKTVQIDYKVRGYSYVAGKSNTSTEAWTLADIPNTITIQKTENVLDIQNVYLDLSDETEGATLNITDKTGTDADQISESTEWLDLATKQTPDWETLRATLKGNSTYRFCFSDGAGGYNCVDAEVVSEVIASDSDLNTFGQNCKNGVYFKEDGTAAEQKEALLTTKIVLAADVDMTKVTQSASEGKGFRGTFDGKGHSVNVGACYTMNYFFGNGIFGHWTQETQLTRSTLKNTNFNNIKWISVLGPNISNADINNCSFAISSDNILYTAADHAILTQAVTRAYFTNCAFDYKGFLTRPTNETGTETAPIYAISTNGGTGTDYYTKFTNCTMTSADGLKMFKDKKSDKIPDHIGTDSPVEGITWTEYQA